MKTRVLLALLCICLPAVSTALGQSAPGDGVDRFIESEMQRRNIPGVGLAVIKDGEPVMVRSYGLANLEHGVPVKPETVFLSGSIGKQFAAFAVMLLVDDGKIDLDAVIGKYLEDVPEAWSGITVRHLLSHTGGLAGDWPEDFQWRKDYTEDEFLDIAKKLPTQFAPGERWEYSNIGYVVLGILIHRVSGMFYGDYLQERVFGPLGMDTTGIISFKKIVPNRAAGYRVEKGLLVNQPWVSPSINTTADGSLSQSMPDMIKWDAALRERKLLSDEAYKAMWSPVRLKDGRSSHYGFGWVIRRVNGHAIVEHGGAWLGFQSFISRYVDDDLTVVVFGNSEQMDPARMAHGIAEAIDPDLKPGPVERTDTGMAGDLVRTYDALISGNADRRRFTPGLAAELIDQPNRAVEWASEEGPAELFFLMGEEKGPVSSTYEFRIQHDALTFFLSATVDADGRISVFDLSQD